MIKRKKNIIFPIVTAVLICAIIAVVVCTLPYFNRMLLISSHPLEYTEYVEKSAAENGIDKYLVYAVIKTESGFDPDAVSNVGARGLMQIMEPTFDWIKYRLGDGDEITYENMFNPEINIRYGCYLIGYLLRYYGVEEVSVCAYHAGTGNVDDWLRNKEYSTDGVNLTKIPISDTAHYLEKIKNAKSNYIKLYKTEDSKNG